MYDIAGKAILLGIKGVENEAKVCIVFGGQKPNSTSYRGRREGHEVHKNEGVSSVYLLNYSTIV